MPLLLLLIGVFMPRIVIVVLYFFTSWFADSFNGFIIPLIGFFVMPITVLWYAIVQYFYGGAWSLIPLIGMVLAVGLDLGIIGRGASRRRRLV